MSHQPITWQSAYIGTWSTCESLDVCMARGTNAGLEAHMLMGLLACTDW